MILFQPKISNNPSFSGKLFVSGEMPKKIMQEMLVLKSMISSKPYDATMSYDDINKSIRFLFVKIAKKSKFMEYIAKFRESSISGELLNGMFEFEDKLMTPWQKFVKKVDNFIFKYILNI